MNINVQIMTLENRIKENEELLKELEETTIRAMLPKELGHGTSYELHDNIRGSRKEVDLFKFAQEKARIELMIEIDKKILNNLKMNIDVEDRIKQLKTHEEKISYLRRLGYTVEEIAERIYLSERHIYRIIRKMKENEEC